MKYKFRLLIAMMLLSLSSFSQTDTKIQQVSNSDTVKLHKEVAKKVVKDLMYLDVLRQERIFLLENIDTLNKQKSYKDSVISYKDMQIKSYVEIVDKYKIKENLYGDYITEMQKEIKKQKLASKVTFGLLAIAVGFIFIK